MSNYALDALWWRLSAPCVRDLASLLTAPPLWDTGCELPVCRLLGATGFRYLLALDDNPAPLVAFLTAQSHQCLGHYAEALLAFWLRHAPHAELLAQELSLRQNGQTLGAADFVVRLNGEVYHIELTCKYYGGMALQGLNPADALADKAARLQEQLRLLARDEAQALWCDLGLEEAPVAKSVVRGMAFLPLGVVHLPELHPLAWCGSLGLPENMPNQWRFYRLPRLGYLAPARVASEQTFAWQEAADGGKGLIAALERRDDGFWHEVLRLMWQG